MASLIRQDLAPAAVRAAHGHRAWRAAPPAGQAGHRTWPRAGAGRGRLPLVRRVAAASAGRYPALLAVVIAYYSGVARVSRNFPQSAVTG